MEGRVVDALERLALATERSAKAQEDLITLATEEREVREQVVIPPFCPHCDTFDPIVRSEGGQGRMSEFALAGVCGNCGNILFAIPESLRMFSDKDQARQYLEERAEQNDESA